SENARLWRLARGTATPVTAEADIVDNFAMSRDGKTIAVVLDLGSTTQLELIDSNGRSMARPSLPAGVISDLLWHPARNEVAFSLAGARAFNDVYSVDASTGRAERWTFSEMGGANHETLPDAEIVKWNSFDGVEISGVLYPPHPRF